MSASSVIVAAPASPSGLSEAGARAVDIMGVPLDLVEPSSAGTRIADLIDAKPGGLIVTPNLDIVRLCTKDPALMSLVRRADLTLADGEPLIWASRIMGSPLQGRAPGSAVMWQVLEEASVRGWPVAVAGGPTGTADAAVQRIQERYPDLHCDGLDLSYELDDVEVARLAHRLRDGGYRLVLLGLGFPRQEHLAERLARTHHVTTWFFGVGAGLEFAAGTKKRAPAVFQRLGIEWLHRLISEPRRLWKRYVVHGIPFAIKLFAWSLRERRRQVERTPVSPTAESRLVSVDD